MRDFLLQVHGIELSSEGLLWIFLPVLLFETSFSLDGRELADDLGPVLTLAIVAVFVTMVVGGLAIWSLSGASLAACLLVAAIIATTDPSAVVAIFREVGAPRRLVGLVEGESLLNDAAAIALFTALLGIVTSGAATTPDLPDLLASFLWEFLGGAALGAVMGRLAAFLIGRIDQGGPAETTLSVALAYLSYGTAELYLHVSGVVAVVLAGLVFGTVGRSRISHHDMRSMTAIWTQLGFWGSSLVFVLASTVAPQNLAETRSWDVVLLVALIAGALAARAFCLFVFLPLLSLGRRRWRVESRYSAVIVWGGLRGAVTLALGLAVTENPFVPADARHLVAVLATGFVLFTLLVQATTLRALLRFLHLNQLDPVERILRQRAMSLTERQIQKRVSEAAITYGIDLERAEEATEIFRRRLEAEDERIELGEEVLRQQLAVALATIAHREGELYVEELARGMIGRRTSAHVTRDVDRLLDALKEGGVTGYRSTARTQLRFRWPTRLAALLHRRLHLQRPLATRLALRAEVLIVRRHVLEDLTLFARTKVKALFGERIAETASRVLEQRLDDVDRATDAMRLQYPSWWQAVSGSLPEPGRGPARARRLRADGRRPPALAAGPQQPRRRTARPAAGVRGHSAARPRARHRPPGRPGADPGRARARGAARHPPSPDLDPGPAGRADRPPRRARRRHVLHRLRRGGGGGRRGPAAARQRRLLRRDGADHPPAAPGRRHRPGLLPAARAAPRGLPRLPQAPSGADAAGPPRRRGARSRQ